MKEKPRYPITIYLLPVVIVLGLIALGMAAYNAFSKVASPGQAIFSALVVEISAIVEALALVRGKNLIGLAGMATSLTVSGTYNYIQARAEGLRHGITGWWELGTLALGPLVALAFLSLTLGQELRKYEKAVKEWEAGQQKAVDDQQQRRRQEALEAEERSRKEREQERATAARLELEKEKARLLAETEQERIRAEEERKAQVSIARIEARKNAQLSAQEETKEAKVSLDWRKLPEEDKRLIASMATKEISQVYQVSLRTAQNWSNWAQPLNTNGKAHD